MTDTDTGQKGEDNKARQASPADPALEPSEDLLSLLRATGRFPARVVGRDGEGFALDVSLSGVFLATATPIAQDEELDVKLTLPGDVTVELHGTVAWVKPDVGGGVKIVSMDDASRQALRGFLRQRAIDLKRERIAQGAAKREATEGDNDNQQRDREQEQGA